MRALTAIGGALLFGAALVASPVQADSSPSPDFGSATISVNVASAPPNTSVTISGTGFPPNELVALYLDSPGPYLGVPGPRADAQGAFTEADTIPGVAGGPHLVCGDTSHPIPQKYVAKACVTFTVIAPASPTPVPAPTGTSGLPLAFIFLIIGGAIGIGIGIAARRPARS